MSVLTKVEAKSTKGRLFLAGVTLALILGGVTMVYPFMLMVTGALHSEMDATDMNAIPSFLYDDTVLNRKFLEMKYNYGTSTMNKYRRYQDYSFLQATVPDTVHATRVEDLKAFAASLDVPPHWWILGGTNRYKLIASKNLDRFVARLRDYYDDDLEAVGKDLGSPLRRWRDVTYAIPLWTSRQMTYEDNPYNTIYQQLLHDRPLAERAFVSISGAYVEDIIGPKYGKDDIDDYNKAHQTTLSNLREFFLPRTVPGEDTPSLRKEWLNYVRTILNTSYVRTTEPDEVYQQFLRDRYATISKLNERWGTDFAGFDAIRLPGRLEWIPTARRVDYEAFIQFLPAESLYLVGPEYAWRDWLKDKYGSLEALKDAHQADYANWQSIHVPTAGIEKQYVQANTSTLRWQFALRNFVNVFDEVVLQGRPMINTFIYVGLALVLCLSIQPLAAYALSRFNPPGTWKFILFFMATMAFPPMVPMIPRYLILRNLGLMNTFIALVLPIIVNGYLIFLLKGFFDSLPRHLYDAALIDGASELRMFWTVTMALSKPILAVVALQTFRMAWMSFMYPLLVCPKEEMHVLAVWLSQFQMSAPTSAVYASILIASIPTMVIFLFTQRTIMKGIAVPAEK
jgi:multiple sugar transport system permease protein